MPSNSASTGNGGGFHHFIPKFTIKRFKFTRTRTNKQSTDEIIRKNCLLVYDVSTATLALRNVKRVFGVTDLYRCTEGTDPGYIETSFCRFEDKVAYVIESLRATIRDCSSIFEITQKDLGLLCQFLFLQSYRRSPLCIASGPLQHWVAQAKMKKGVVDDAAVWKDCLVYLLQTTHEELVQEAQAITQQLGKDAVDRMIRTTVDPSVNGLALEYATFAYDYSMSICEASDDSEFLLGDNSFGAGERYTSSGTCIHKVYVLNPRVAVVLRLLNHRDTSSNPSITGSLSALQMNHCELSRTARGDMYRFHILKLTKSETHSVNAVLLDNLSDKSSFIFRSKSFMLDTLTAYRGSHGVQGRRFDKLLETLSEDCAKIQKPIHVPVPRAPARKRQKWH